MALPMRRSEIPPPLDGINYSSDLLTVNSYEVYKAINMHLDEHGRYVTRGGSRALNLTALDGAVTGIYDFRRPDGTGTTSILLVKSGTILYSLNTSTGAATQIVDTNVTTRPSFTTFYDGSGNVYAYIADGTNFYKYDGTTLSDAAASYPWASGAPRYLWVFKDRMLAAGIDVDPYKVYVSSSLDGTDWTPGGGGATATFWTMDSAQGDRITALNQFYDFGVIQQQFGTTIITGPDADASDTQQIVISRDYGTTSHWSVQSVGNMLYFADESHIYRGTLRNAVENGMLVEPIDESILGKYSGLTNASDITSVYDAVNEEIQWGIKSTQSTTTNDVSVVYSIARSQRPGPSGKSDVWSGWFEGDGYEPYTLSPVLNKETKYRADGTSYTEEVMRVYRGDSSGYVYVMDEDRANTNKDETVSDGATVDNDIVSEIITAPLKPAGISRRKRGRLFVPAVFQRYDESTTVEWIIDGRRRLPSTPVTLKYRNIAPYWDSSSTNDKKQLWGNTVWDEQTPMVKSVRVGSPFNYIQFVIKNDGSNNRDRITYIGGDFTYQIHGYRSPV